MPRSTTYLGSRGHQAVSHGPLAAWRSHGGGHDCAPPVCGEHQLGAGCRCNTLGLLHSVRRDSCGTVTAAARYGTFAHLQPCGHSGQRCSTRRGGSITVSFTQDNGDTFPSWQHACLSRDAVLRPCSVGWQMLVRVHVNGWKYSGDTQYALQVMSGNETPRPLICVACAVSSDSSISMPLGVVARSSPAIMDGKRPSWSSWCEFRSTAITAARPKRRMLLAK
ncbi:hypothetical protein TCDM_12762 [Trypanosoma cruzi Dm28c]|uniref:Uncharacterized protein n=1 Tax=Trypanosoma cruzi Dm28c TaxID=1416333 RepID=V5AUG9_TRYCR|nr:hypothetical protein TCDM_12762 [Trypanosoma cruzi Dm28c]